MKKMKNKKIIAQNATTAVQVPDICAEIVSIVRSTLTPKALCDKLSSYHEKDIAMSLDMMNDSERSKLFRILSTEDTVKILEYSQNMCEYFDLLGTKRQIDVLSAMEASSAADILNSLPREKQDILVDLMSPETMSDISLVSSFDEDEIGSRMSTNYIEISDRCTVKSAMNELVSQAANNDNISMLYVTDGCGTFCGAIDLKDLIIARDGSPLQDITKFSYPYVYARSKIDDCIPYLIDYSESSIPVLDDKNKLIGTVTAEDFMEVIDSELGEDYAKLGGLTSEEELSEPVLRSVKKRLPWLAILLVMGLGVSATVGLFESIVAQLPIIMCFQSLILDMSGNVGTQSLAVAIRVLMDKQICGKRKAFLALKEMRIGLLNGLAMGVLSLVAIGGYLCLKGYSPSFAFTVSACLGVAMLLAMVISSLSGTLIPVFFDKIGVDPAVASGPLITTVNDLVAVVTYYGLAWLILIHWLHLV